MCILRWVGHGIWRNGLGSAARAEKQDAGGYTLEEDQVGRLNIYPKLDIWNCKSNIRVLFSFIHYCMHFHVESVNKSVALVFSLRHNTVTLCTFRWAILHLATNDLVWWCTRQEVDNSFCKILQKTTQYPKKQSSLLNIIDKNWENAKKCGKFMGNHVGLSGVVWVIQHWPICNFSPRG